MFQTNGNCEAELHERMLPLFLSRLRTSNEVSFTLFGEKVTACPGKKKQDIIRHHLALLMPAEITELYAANDWFGATGRGTLVAVMKLPSALKLRIQLQDTVFPKIGRWENLALYENYRVSLWSCTHEKTGVVYGSQVELERFNAQDVRASTNPRCNAEKFEPGMLQEILAGIAV